jgi:hypothetical protein
MAERDNTVYATRKEAIAAGGRFYLSRKPCPKGHQTARMVNHRACRDCVSEFSTSERRRRYHSFWERKQHEAGPKAGWARRAHCSIRGRAARKGILFELTAAQLLAAAPDVCPALGIVLDYGLKGAVSGPRQNSPSVDRLDPALGYVAGNFAVISHKANGIKQAATAVEIRRVADWLETVERLR